MKIDIKKYASDYFRGLAVMAIVCLLVALPYGVGAALPNLFEGSAFEQFSENVQTYLGGVFYIICSVLIFVLLVILPYEIGKKQRESSNNQEGSQ